MNLLNDKGSEFNLPDGSVDKAVQFFIELLNPLKEVSNIGEDCIKYLRFKNQVNLLLKARRFCEEKGISPKKVPLKVLVPLLENSSLEEDEDIGTKWENLLINSLNPACEYSIIPSYIEILKQISPYEALFLDEVYDIFGTSRDFSLATAIDIVHKKMKFQIQNYQIFIDNLVRLNLIRWQLTEELYNEIKKDKDWERAYNPYLKQDNNYWMLYNDFFINTDTLRITTLGSDFIESCRRK